MTHRHPPHPDPDPDRFDQAANALDSFAGEDFDLHPEPRRADPPPQVDAAARRLGPDEPLTSRSVVGSEDATLRRPVVGSEDPTLRASAGASEEPTMLRRPSGGAADPTLRKPAGGSEDPAMRNPPSASAAPPPEQPKTDAPPQRPPRKAVDPRDMRDALHPDSYAMLQQLSWSEHEQSGDALQREAAQAWRRRFFKVTLAGLALAGLMFSGVFLQRLPKIWSGANRSSPTTDVDQQASANTDLPKDDRTRAEIDAEIDRLFPEVARKPSGDKPADQTASPDAAPPVTAPPSDAASTPPVAAVPPAPPAVIKGEAVPEKDILPPPKSVPAPSAPTVAKATPPVPQPAPPITKPAPSSDAKPAPPVAAKPAPPVANSAPPTTSTTVNRPSASRSEATAATRTPPPTAAPSRTPSPTATPPVRPPLEPPLSQRAAAEPSPSPAAPAPAPTSPAPAAERLDTPALTAPAAPPSLPPPVVRRTEPAPAGAPPAPAAANVASNVVRRPEAVVAGNKELDTNAIAATLNRYRDAFTSLDANAAHQIWPTVNQRTLQKAFERLRQQQVSFDKCQIDVGDARAQAVCNGTQRYVPRVGSSTPQVDQRRWTFNLVKVRDEWLIGAVDAR